ncbi:MAG: hypothetical protein WCG79_03030 [Verrucomicrobiota bacterium]
MSKDNQNQAKPNDLGELKNFSAASVTVSQAILESAASNQTSQDIFGSGRVVQATDASLRSSQLIFGPAVPLQMQPAQPQASAISNVSANAPAAPQAAANTTPPVSDSK